MNISKETAEKLLKISVLLKEMGNELHNISESLDNIQKKREQAGIYP